MKKLYLALLFFGCLPAFNYLQAQCSVVISTNTNTTQLNCTNPTITLTADAEGTTPISYLWSTMETTASITIKDPGTYEVTIKATGGCTTKSKITITKDISIPTVTIMAFPERICAGDSATLVAFGASTYVWDSPINSSAEAVSVKPDTSTFYSVTGRGLNGCTATESKQVSVNSPINYDLFITDSSVCQNKAEVYLFFRAGGSTAPYTFNYNINGKNTQSIQTNAQIGNDSYYGLRIPTDVLGQFTYKLLSISDGDKCVTVVPGDKTQTFSVLPPATLTSPKTRVECSNQEFTYQAESSVADKTTFRWKRILPANVSGLPGKGNGETSLIQDKFINNGTQPATVVYAFELTTGAGCTRPDTLQVIVNPRPVINPIPDTIYCNGSFVVSGIPFSSTSPGARFTWTNSDTTMGLPATGTGDLPAFIAKNNTSKSITADVEVFVRAYPENCAGEQSEVFKITVLPTALLNSTKDTSICDSTLFTYNAESLTVGTKFNWTRPALTGISNPAASGNTAVISERLDNTTDQPVTVEYIFTLTAPGKSCISIETLKVIVNPTPVIDPVSPKTYCNEDFVTGGISFTSKSPDAVFNWVNNNTSIGLPASGNGSILPFNALNYSPDPANANIIVSVMGGANQCPGPDLSFTISVLPGLKLTSTRDTAICDSTRFQYIAVSTANTAVYKWKRLNAANITPLPQTSFQSSSSINEILKNGSSDPVLVEYVFEMSTGDNLCISYDTVRLTVFPTPTFEPFSNTVRYCNNESDNNGIVLGYRPSNAILSWTNSNKNIGLPVSGIGNISPFVATNLKQDIPDTAQINLSLSVYNGRCSGSAAGFRIVVFPTPLLSSNKDTSVCDKAIFAYSAVSPAVNTLFRWKRNAVTGIDNKADSSIGATISERLYNTTPNPVNVNYIFTLSVNGRCVTNETVVVRVNPTPVLDSIQNFTYCSGSKVGGGINFKSATNNAVYNWVNNNPKIGIQESGTGNIPAFEANNPEDTLIKGKIDVAITAGIGGCSGNPRSFTVFVKPNPPRPFFTAGPGVLNRDTLTVCEGSENINFNVNRNAILPGISYAWTNQNAINNPKVIIKDSNSSATVISFLKSGSYKVECTADKDGCTLTAVQWIRVLPTPGIEERRIFLKQPGNLLIYPDNSLGAYQWGYDDSLSAGSYGFPTPVPNQVYQFFTPDQKFIKGNLLDTTKYLYWVSLKNDAGCISRVYFNGPYAARQSKVIQAENPVQLFVFPNPSKGSFSIALRGNIYGDIGARIVNTLGQEVYRKKFVKRDPEIYEPFDAGRLADGVYFIELISSDLKKVMTRFIIQH